MQKPKSQRKKEELLKELLAIAHYNRNDIGGKKVILLFYKALSAQKAELVEKIKEYRERGFDLTETMNALSFRANILDDIIKLLTDN